jgi:hypothetical protein
MHRFAATTLLLLVLLLAACGSSTTPVAKVGVATDAGNRPTPIPPPAPGDDLSQMAGQIARRPRDYEGQTVTLVGYFRGLDLLDEIPTEAPRDRVSDWVITDGSGALWVAYSSLLPFPPTSQEVWRIVRATGSIRLTDSGAPYLAPTRVEWEGLRTNTDMLPALCRVAIHRYGGPSGLDHHIYWYEIGTLSVVDKAADWKGAVSLKQNRQYELERAFNKAGFFALSPTVGDACDGCVRYEIAAVDAKANRAHYVASYEGSVPPALQAFIDLAIAETANAKPFR